jgi:hypothetical protein
VLSARDVAVCSGDAAPRGRADLDIVRCPRSRVSSREVYYEAAVSPGTDVSTPDALTATAKRVAFCLRSAL